MARGRSQPKRASPSAHEPGLAFESMVLRGRTSRSGWRLLLRHTCLCPPSVRDNVFKLVERQQALHQEVAEGTGWAFSSSFVREIHQMLAHFLEVAFDFIEGPLKFHIPQIRKKLIPLNERWNRVFKKSDIIETLLECPLKIIAKL
jgi:hypothetical protein